MLQPRALLVQKPCLLVGARRKSALQGLGLGNHVVQVLDEVLLVRLALEAA